MSNCIPAFPNDVPFTCIFDFIRDVRNGNAPVELIEKGLWIAGGIVSKFKAVPSPIQLFSEVTALADVSAQIESRLVDLERVLGMIDSPGAVGIDWMAVLTLILKLIELIPQR